jgi:hypothetical protein
MPPNRLLMRRCLQSETGFHFASQDANSSGEVPILPNGKLDFPKILRTRKGGSTIIEISQSSSSKIPIFFDGLWEQCSRNRLIAVQGDVSMAADIRRLFGETKAALATVIYVGVENLLRPDGPTQRWRLTLIFGLAHGLGFATEGKARGYQALR